MREWYAVACSFAYYFSILAAYYIMRPLRDQLAAKVGSALLPWFFTATFIATLFLTPLFSWLVSRWPRQIIMPLVHAFFIGCQLVFVFLFHDENFLPLHLFGLLFFVWVSIFNLFVVSVFWSFMTDIWSESQACRLFPIIALGGTMGAVLGPIITRSLVDVLGLSLLLSVSVGFLLAAVGCVIGLGRWAHTHGANKDKTDHEAPLRGGMLDGLKQIFTHRFIFYMSFMMLLSDAIGTIAYVLVTDYSGIAFSGNTIEQTRFAATMDLSANVTQIIVQVSLTRWLLMRYGPISVFALWTVIIVTACLTMTFVENPYSPIIGIMPSVALATILTRSLSYGMLQPARETLYTLVPRDLRYKGKNAVDTVIWRAGDVTSLLSVNGLKALGTNASGFGLLWAALAALSGMIGCYLAKHAEKGEFAKPPHAS